MPNAALKHRHWFFPRERERNNKKEQKYGDRNILPLPTDTDQILPQFSCCAQLLRAGQTTRLRGTTISPKCAASGFVFLALLQQQSRPMAFTETDKQASVQRNAVHTQSCSNFATRFTKTDNIKNHFCFVFENPFGTNNRAVVLGRIFPRAPHI